ncbi:hypothetical protein TNIN_86041 [Trichonephila inaurata madagascariensis]|uniref:Uncharacterized protein n=1 Tax=Trichonephila inaurata madagascariensis TaxID=2747483 RepID=A0A8X6XBA3_9ARAC|nr:hypothetical protein TNIN_86041 [Trichonephila inaurata madagascariensis]
MNFTHRHMNKKLDIKRSKINITLSRISPHLPNELGNRPNKVGSSCPQPTMHCLCYYVSFVNRDEGIHQHTSSSKEIIFIALKEREKIPYLEYPPPRFDIK